MRVTLFKKPTCDKCEALYDKLKKNKIEFGEELLEEHLQELIQMAKEQGIEDFDTPVVVCNGKLYCNIDYEKFIELVNS